MNKNIWGGFEAPASFLEIIFKIKEKKINLF